MFERRVKIVVAIVVCIALVLITRAGKVQIADHAAWTREAAEDAERTAYIDAPRGRILDVKGRVLAVDEWCLDARVDYRVIPKEPDPAWLRQKAIVRARTTEGYRSLERAQRETRIKAKQDEIRGDLEAMWNALAAVSGTPRSEIDARRAEIVEKVLLRQETIWSARYDKALADYQTQPRRPAWQRWFLGETTAPKASDFHQPIGEQLQSHIVLSDLSSDAIVTLKMGEDQFAGALTLTPSIARRYPYNDVAAHVIGRLSPVQKGDLEQNATRELRRRYRTNDLIGRQGIEWLAEDRLRGTLGVARTNRSKGNLTGEDAALPGQDVQTSIDIDVQRDIQHAFEEVKFVTPENAKETMPMPGAAVVIDIATGQVRALVSYPSFDLNHFDEHFATLNADEINRPLSNRALRFTQAPGSTVKPIVGMGAITQGLMSVNDTIECTGYLVLNGHVVSPTAFRCWTMSQFGFGHHAGSHPHATGFLTYADAIERSCNVYFETLADRLGLQGLAYWFAQFGLGSPTGVGLGESDGDLPGNKPIPVGEVKSVTWLAGIGQSEITATPIQLANVMATFAREGVWLKPRLLTDSSIIVAPDIADRRDLHLNPDALRSLHEGMKNVVNAEAGTGKQAQRGDLLLAAKTGTATVNEMKLVERSPTGELLLDERGRPIYTPFPFGTTAAPNPAAPWYRVANVGKNTGSHSWYVGYAPADHPTVAFAVFVEFGGSGGSAAGSVVRVMTQSLIDHGYLPGQTSAEVAAQAN